VIRLAVVLVVATGCGAPRMLLDLPVPGFEPAVVATPGGDEARPVMAVLHGSYGRPEWICEAFAKVTLEREWVVCPRGVRRPDPAPNGPRWTQGKLTRTLAELDASLAAARRQFGDQMGRRARILAGFSLGAAHAARLGLKYPARFNTLLLHEGGRGLWTRRNARRFADGGGRAVVFGCGSQRCQTRAEKACAALTRAGVYCAAFVDVAVGHSYNPPFTRLGRRLYEAVLLSLAR